MSINVYRGIQWKPPDSVMLVRRRGVHADAEQERGFERDSAGTRGVLWLPEHDALDDHDQRRAAPRLRRDSLRQLNRRRFAVKRSDDGPIPACLPRILESPGDTCRACCKLLTDLHRPGTRIHGDRPPRASCSRDDAVSPRAQRSIARQ